MPILVFCLQLRVHHRLTKKGLYNYLNGNQLANIKEGYYLFRCKTTSSQTNTKFNEHTLCAYNARRNVCELISEMFVCL